MPIQKINIGSLSIVSVRTNVKYWMRLFTQKYLICEWCFQALGKTKN
jgi:hypothetical protein